MWRALLLAASAGAVVIALLAHQALLQAVGDFLAPEDPLAPADAVIAISGDGRERVRTAAEIFHQGYVTWVVLSGGPAHRGSGSAQEMARYAQEFGTPAERILLDERATTTVANAQGSAQVMEERGLRRAILVTSPYHMRRAIIIFRAAFAPRGLSVQAYPARDSFLDLEAWWKRPQTRQFVLREYAKLVAFLIGIR